jgi:hypothetical protein
MAPQPFEQLHIVRLPEHRVKGVGGRIDRMLGARQEQEGQIYDENQQNECEAFEDADK